MADLTALTAEARAEVAAAPDGAALESVRVRWLGKKGTFTEQLKELGRIPPAERPAAGARINEAKDELTRVIEARREALERIGDRAVIHRGRVLRDQESGIGGTLGESRGANEREQNDAVHTTFAFRITASHFSRILLATS